MNTGSDADYWMAKRKVAREKARQAAWQSDPELRAQSEAILSMPPLERLRQIEEEVAFFDGLRLIES